MGQSNETQAGQLVKVLGRTGDNDECLICSDGKHRYDRGRGAGSDDGRVTGTAHDYCCPDNFRRVEGIPESSHSVPIGEDDGTWPQCDACRGHVIIDGDMGDSGECEDCGKQFRIPPFIPRRFKRQIVDHHVGNSFSLAREVGAKVGAWFYGKWGGKCTVCDYELIVVPEEGHVPATSDI